MKKVLLYYLDKEWCNYLGYVSYIREGIHLISLSKEDPLHHYHVLSIEAFEKITKNIEDETNKNILAIINSGNYNINLMLDLKGPSETWTYIVNDNEFLNRVKNSKITQKETHFVSFKFIFTWPIIKIRETRGLKLAHGFFTSYIRKGIDMKKFRKIEPTTAENRKLKVAAYCRVSIKFESQHSSIDLQISNYETVIQSNPQ